MLRIIKIGVGCGQWFVKAFEGEELLEGVRVATLDEAKRIADELAAKYCALISIAYRTETCQA